MKTMYLKLPAFKALTIGVGISVGALTLSFLISFFLETRDEIRSRTKKSAPITQKDPVYTEVHGMN